MLEAYRYVVIKNIFLWTSVHSRKKGGQRVLVQKGKKNNCTKKYIMLNNGFKKRVGEFIIFRYDKINEETLISNVFMNNK